MDFNIGDRFILDQNACAEAMFPVHIGNNGISVCDIGMHNILIKANNIIELFIAQKNILCTYNEVFVIKNLGAVIVRLASEKNPDKQFWLEKDEFRDLGLFKPI